MSGIAGFFCLDGKPADPADLERMHASLARRGTDDGGLWQEGPAGLAQRILWTTPESLSERLPLVDAEGSLALVADARLDNRDELIASLGLQGRRPEEMPDSRLILAAYERWGEACPEKLIGDFAFAIWDARRQVLFCARDPMGVRPLYYHQQAGRVFAFASTIGTVLCLPETPRRINEVRLADHLAFLSEDRSLTFYQEVYLLPAAHCLLVGPEGLRLRRYWQPDEGYELRLHSDEDYAEAYREVFGQAVRCRLRSAYPVGSLLSGGLDSSSIVAMARRLLAEEGRGRRLHTFSAVFPTLAEAFPQIDERPWIEAVLAQGELEPHFVSADRLDPLEALGFDDDEPAAVPNLWLDWGCFKLAREAGLRAVLSGYDGDSAVSYGYGHLAELARSLRFRALYAETNALVTRLNRPRRRLLKERVFKPLAPPLALKAWRALLRRQPPSLFPFEPAVNPAFARRIGLLERARALAGDGQGRFRSDRRYHCESLFSGMLLYGVELIDRLGAAWGLEPRLPFFDRRFLEFAISLPAGQKLRLGWERYVARRAMEGILPASVQWRTGKGNLRANVRRGLSENRAALEPIFLEDLSLVEDYVDAPALRAAYRRFAENPLQTSETDLFNLLAALTLVRWLLRSGVSA